jgi:hypothetical protein
MKIKNPGGMGEASVQHAGMSGWLEKGKRHGEMIAVPELTPR